MNRSKRRARRAGVADSPMLALAAARRKSLARHATAAEAGFHDAIRRAGRSRRQPRRCRARGAARFADDETSARPMFGRGALEPTSRLVPADYRRDRRQAAACLGPVPSSPACTNGPTAGNTAEVCHGYDRPQPSHRADIGYAAARCQPGVPPAAERYMLTLAVARCPSGPVPAIAITLPPTNARRGICRHRCAA